MLERQMTMDSTVAYHKTLPALTQTAGVQVYDSSLAPKIKRYMDMYETSSPSYVLMNSVAKMACQSKCARIQLPSSGARAGERPTSGIMVAKIRFVRLAG